MFKTPDIKTISLLGTDIPVVISSWKCNRIEADGVYEAECIFLREAYETEAEYKRILTHEAFHALYEIIGCQLDIHMEETLAHLISKHMTLNVLT